MGLRVSFSNKLLGYVNPAGQQATFCIARTQSSTSPIWLHVRISRVVVQSADATPRDLYLIGLGCALGIEISFLSSPSDSNVQPGWETSRAQLTISAVS